MRKYKGYYIDGVIFHNQYEIDNFIKNEIIHKIKVFYNMFSSDIYTGKEKMALSDEITQREIRLHDEFGLDWDEIEELPFIS